MRPAESGMGWNSGVGSEPAGKTSDSENGSYLLWSNKNNSIFKIKFSFSEKRCAKPKIPEIQCRDSRIPYRVEHIMDRKPVLNEIQKNNSWSNEDKSNNIHINVSLGD